MQRKNNRITKTVGEQKSDCPIPVLFICYFYYNER